MAPLLLDDRSVVVRSNLRFGGLVFFHLPSLHRNLTKGTTPRAPDLIPIDAAGEMQYLAAWDLALELDRIPIHEDIEELHPGTATVPAAGKRSLRIAFEGHCRLDGIALHVRHHPPSAEQRISLPSANAGGC